MRARPSLRGNPFSARSMAGWSTCSKLIVPQRSSRMYHASTTPGSPPDSSPSLIRNLAVAVLLVPLDGRQLGSAWLRVDGEHFFLARIVNEHNRVTADAIEGKVGDRKCCLTANNCIERVAALCKMRLATSVASAFIDDTAACRPRITGRMCGVEQRLGLGRWHWRQSPNRQSACM